MMQSSDGSSAGMEEDRQRRRRQWALKGFDVSAFDPDIAVFRPNWKRSRALMGALIFTSVFFSIFGLAPTVIWMGMTGILPPSSGDHLPTFSENPGMYVLMTALAMATFAVVLTPMIVLFHDEIWNRLTPISLDRRRDELRYGKRVLCRLSEIDQVVLREMISNQANKPPIYGAAVRLKSGRAIPYVGIRGIIVRYALGPQEMGVEDVFQEIADFVGVSLEVRREKQDYGGTGDARGM